MITTGNTRRFQNLEGFSSYDCSLNAGGTLPGVSAMLRVKNEAPKVRGCLASLFDIFDEIVVIDNGSSDGTQDIVRQFKQEHDRQEKMAVYDYPFKVARCGPEHDATPEDSVHNLAYYYNWALSHCTRRYVCKWDADMLVRREARQSFLKRLGELDHTGPRVVTLKGQTVYRDATGRCFLAADEVMSEPRLFPYDCDNYFIKVDHFERLRFNPSLPLETFDDIVFYELKFVDEDEFSHWSTTHFPTPRKQREWENVELLRGDGSGNVRFEPLPDRFLEEQCAGRLADGE